ncbi:MAG: glycine cleavage system protein GcvH [Phycisphaerae bacterium]|nr:glycine cleavage system protein GcvH [Phycisphaerae bacterium]
MIPENLKYTQSHEWAAADSDGKIVTIGISDFAIEHLGDIVYLELPEVGEKVSKGSSFGIVESVKAASDLNSPVSGEVVEVNTALPDDLETLKSDAYKQGWMIKVATNDTDDYQALMDSSAYNEYLKTQED